MGNPSRSPGFQKLLQEWNRKLSDSGFRDIETQERGELRLKQSGTMRRFERMDPITKEARLDYYSQLSEKISVTRFECDFEKQILTLYAQGHSQAAIYRMLGLRGHRCKVYYPLYRWLRKWGLKA